MIPESGPHGSMPPRNLIVMPVQQAASSPARGQRRNSPTGACKALAMPYMWLIELADEFCFAPERTDDLSLKFED